jgi:hypothetical protein
MHYIKLISVPQAAQSAVTSLLVSDLGLSPADASTRFAARTTSPIYNFTNAVDPDVHRFMGRLVQTLAPWPSAKFTVGRHPS